MKTSVKEPLTLLIDSSKKKAFLNALKLFDFVTVESTEQRVKRYLKSAPQNVTISDKEIMKEVKAVRNKRS